MNLEQIVNVLRQAMVCKPGLTPDDMLIFGQAWSTLIQMAEAQKKPAEAQKQEPKLE